MKKAQLLVLCLGLAALSGCYRYAIQIGRGGDLSASPVSSEWSHHFINGLVGEPVVDISAVCPSGDATVRIERNVIDSILNNVTGAFLWAPSHVDVYCGGERRAEVELKPDHQLRIARSPAFLDAVQETAPDRLEEATAVAAAL